VRVGRRHHPDNRSEDIWESSRLRAATCRSASQQALSYLTPASASCRPTKTALLIPVVPAGLAGAGLTAFSGGLLGLYAKTPGMRKEGTLLPTQQGIPLAKDIWMAGIGIGLIVDALTDGSDGEN
jgi:hypothetical protein